MMRLPLALVALVVPATLSAQITNPASVNTTALQTSITAAQTQAAQALSAAQTAQAAAATACQGTAAVPAPEIVGGAAGSGSACRLANAVQPRITRATVGTTASDGTVAVTWTALASVPIVIPVPMVGSTAAQVPICAPVQGTVTTSGVTIKCYTTQSVTVSILGAVVAPVTTAASGVQVQVFAVPQT